MTVTVVPPEGRDKYGNPEPGGAEVPLEGAILAPRPEPDVLGRGREGVIVGLELFAPPGTRFEHDARIRIDGGPWAGLWDVEGEPGVWVNPYTGNEHGIQAALRRAEG